MLEYPSDPLYDLIFIDGGHQYEVAKQDLENCRRFAHADTVVAMDDTVHSKDMQAFWAFWTLGPTKAWMEAVAGGIVTEIAHIDFAPGRGISWGRYLGDSSSPLPARRS